MANPISDAEQKRLDRKAQRIWKSGRFILIRSAEGAMSTSESVRGLRPADPEPPTG